jgi:hypothetical protein
MNVPQHMHIHNPGIHGFKITNLNNPLPEDSRFCIQAMSHGAAQFAVSQVPPWFHLNLGAFSRIATFRDIDSQRLLPRD